MTEAQAVRLAALLARPEVAAVLTMLCRDGEAARLVGGAVRNALLGEPVADIDIATTALPEEVMRRARAAGLKPVPTGLAHGTVTVVAAGVPVEVTTLRRDLETDGRHAVVAFGRDFREDALRRDFTINALGLDADGGLHDYAGGLADLAARRLRFIGEASQRIAEDYLRILRFFRFHARYGAGAPDPEGLAACIAGRAGLAGLSRERVRAETLKLLVAPGAVATLQAMTGAGLLMPVIGRVPRLTRFAAIAEEPGEGVHPAFRLAALAVATLEDAEALRVHLRLSNEEAERIAAIAGALEALSGRAALPEIAAIRMAATRLGRDGTAAALVLIGAGGRETGRVETLIAALARTPPFLPKGKDVLALGVPPGPEVGRTLAAARSAWIAADCPAGREAQLGLLAEAVALTAT